MGDMAQRPKPFIGEAEIETFLFLFTEPDAAQTVLRVIRRHAQPASIVGGLAVGIAGALRDPGSIAGPQHRLERRYQTAGRNGPGDRIPLMNMFVRLAVGDCEQAAPVE